MRRKIKKNIKGGSGRLTRALGRVYNRIKNKLTRKRRSAVSFKPVPLNTVRSGFVPSTVPRTVANNKAPSTVATDVPSTVANTKAPSAVATAVSTDVTSAVANNKAPSAVPSVVPRTVTTNASSAVATAVSTDVTSAVNAKFPDRPNDNPFATMWYENNTMYADVNILNNAGYKIISEYINNYVKSINNNTEPTKYEELIKKNVKTAYDFIYTYTNISDIYKMMAAYNNMIHRLILHLYELTNSQEINIHITSLLLVYYNRKIYLNELYTDIIDTLNELKNARLNNSYTKTNMTRIFEIRFNILKNYIDIHIPIHSQQSKKKYNKHINAIDYIYGNITSNIQNNNGKSHSISDIIDNIKKIEQITYTILKIPNNINITYINLIYHIIKLILNEQNNTSNTEQINILINLLIQKITPISINTLNKFTINTLIKYLTLEIEILLKVYGKSANTDLITQINALTINILKSYQTAKDNSVGFGNNKTTKHEVYAKMLYNNATYEYTLTNKKQIDTDIFDLGYDIIIKYIDKLSSFKNNTIKGNYDMNNIFVKLKTIAYFYYYNNRTKEQQMRAAYYLMKDKIKTYVFANIKDSAKKYTILNKLDKLYRLTIN
jgi:hypothetical protein